MVALYLAPIYILVNGYIIWRLIKWVKSCHDLLNHVAVYIVLTAIYVFFACSIPIGFLVSGNQIGRLLKQIGNYWLGIQLYSVMMLVISELVAFGFHLYYKKKKRPFRRRTTAIIGAAAILATAGICIYGGIHARHIYVIKDNVSIAKDAGERDKLKIVLAADLHMGVNFGSREIERMAEKINAQNPDIVVLAGDIFDNSYENLDDPDRLIEIFRGIKSTYGVYACHGNHDVEEKILAGFTFKKDTVDQKEMDHFLEEAGITLLDDEAVLVADSFYLVGRRDYSMERRGIMTRKSPEELLFGLDLNKPIIVMDHQPRELEELAKAGADLDLSGHTHDGQMFPGNILTALTSENACGEKKVGSMESIVTGGVGVFGPFMRVGTKSEIRSITVNFTPEEIKQ